MTKYRCTGLHENSVDCCAGMCEMITGGCSRKPSTCYVDNKKVLWEEVPEQKPETTLPDWCKVGEWVWNKPAEEYVKITDISNGLITGKGVCDKIDYTEWHLSYYCEARLRPYNAKEMRGLVGKVLEWGYNSELVISYNEAEVEVYVDRMWCNAEYLMNNEYTIDGKPCGKFEHLNDNGEWVE